MQKWTVVRLSDFPEESVRDLVRPIARDVSGIYSDSDGMGFVSTDDLSDAEEQGEEDENEAVHKVLVWMQENNADWLFV